MRTWLNYRSGEARTILEEDPMLVLPEHYLLAQFIGESHANTGDIS